MRVSSEYRELYSGQRINAPDRLKSLDWLPAVLKKQGIILRAKLESGTDLFSARWHKAILASYWRDNGPIQSLIYRFYKMTPHWDKTVWIVDAVFGGLQDQENLRPGTIFIDNLLMRLITKAGTSGPAAWEKENIEAMVTRELPQLLQDPQIFIPPGRRGGFPRHVLTPFEEKERLQKLIPQEHYDAGKIIENLSKTHEPPSEEELGSMMLFRITGQDEMAKVIALFMARPRKIMSPIFRKLILSIRAQGMAIGEDFGDSAGLFTEKTRDWLSERNPATDSSDDDYQPWRALGVNLRQDLLNNVFGRDFSEVYFEAYWLSKQISRPGGLLGEQAKLAQEWSGGGLFENGTTVPSYFRMSVHYGPNDRDFRLLRAIVEWWEKGNQALLSRMRERNEVPLNLWIDTPERTTQRDKEHAVKLLGLMERHYEFCASIEAEDFKITSFEPVKTAAEYSAADACGRFNILTQTRQKLFELTHNMTVEGRPGPGQIINNEHKIYEAALLNAREAQKGFASVTVENFRRAIDFMRGIVDNLEFCGFEVLELKRLMGQYSALLDGPETHYQGLYALQLEFNQRFAAAINAVQQSFEGIYNSMLESKEWKEKTHGRGYRHFMDYMQRRGFFNELSVISERINRCLLEELERQGIDPAQLCLSEVKGITGLRQVNIPRDASYLYVIGEGQRFNDPGIGARLLGNKGLMQDAAARRGLRVPEAVALTSRFVAEAFDGQGHMQGQFSRYINEGISYLELSSGKRFGDAAHPLLISIRPAAPIVIPGAMDTILNVGMNRDVADNLAAVHNKAFAFSTYVNFALSFGIAALGLEASKATELKRNALEAFKADPSLRQRLDDITDRVQEAAKREIPFEVQGQLIQGVEGVYSSYFRLAAADFRRRYGVPENWKMAIMLQRMVFGNLNANSASYSASSHDPVTGKSGIFGDMLAGQGMEIMSGWGNVSAIDRNPGEIISPIIDQALGIIGGPIQAEITVEDGVPYVLQLKKDALSPAAALRAAVELTQAGITSRREAVCLAMDNWNKLFGKQFTGKAGRPTLTSGIPASAGAAVGRIAFDLEQAGAIRQAGDKAILVVNYLTDEAEGQLFKISGIVAKMGGIGSHAANVSRQMCLPCVAGCVDMELDPRQGQVKFGNKALSAGNWISIDGSTGQIFTGQLRMVNSEIASVLSGRKKPEDSNVYQHYLAIKEWAGAEGISL